MLLQECNIRFTHTKSKDNILADAIPRLHPIIIYKYPAAVKSQHPTISKSQLESRKVTDNMPLLGTGPKQQLLNIATKTLRSLQKTRQILQKESP